MRRIAAIALSFALATGAVACDSPKNNTGSGPGVSSSAASDTAPRPVADVRELTTKIIAATNQVSSAKVAFESSGDSSTDNGNGSGSGVLRYTPNGPEMSIDIKSSDGPTESSMILLGGDAYIKLPPGTLPGGKSWIKISRTGNDPMSKMFASMIDMMKQTGSIEHSVKLIGDAGSITASQAERIDGTDAVRYAIAIDLDKASASTTDQTLKTAYKTLTSAGVKTFEYLLWVNNRDLPVKMMMDQHIPTPDGKTTTMKMSMTYSDWGKPVTITAPPANEIGTLEDLGK